jgi:hypothetical protein
MSYTSNQINSQSLNGIINLTDGVLNIEDGIISNIQQLNVIGNSELDGDLIVDGKISCAYNALLPSDVVNKNYVDDALNNNSRFLRVDGTNKMNANLNVGDKYIYNLLDPSGNQDATTKYYTDTADNLRLLKSGGIMTGILDLSGNRIIKLATGVDDTDCVNKLQMVNADNLRLLKSGDTMTGILDMSANRIIKLATGIDDTDCVNKLQMNNADNLRLLKSGDTMTGILDLSGNRIIKLATGVDDTDCVNKLQMNNADNLRLLKSGGTMSGNLDMSGNNIININNLASATSTYLHLLIGNTILIQLTPEQVVFKAPILINGIASGGTGIYMAGTKIANLSDATNPQDAINKQQMDNADNLRLLKGGDTMSGGLNMGGNIITNLPYPSSDITDAVNKNYCDTEDNKRLRLDGNSPMTGNINCNGNNITNIGSIQSQIGGNLNLQSGTTTIMQIQPLKVFMSMPIDMNSKLINGLGNGVATSDAVNKGQMDTADLLKMDKTNGVGTGTMILTHNLSQLKLVCTGTSGNLILQNTNASNGCLIDFWDSSSVSVASIQTGHVSRTINILTGTSTAMTIGTTLINCLKPTQITGTLTMVAGGLSPIDMSGNDITKVSNINSNGTNALNLQHNSTTKVKIDSGGILMQNSGNIDMNNGTISNTTLTTPKITAPIQTTTSSSYSFINNSYLNIGYTVSNSYNIYTTMTQTTYYPLLGTSGTPPVNNRITVDPGVWIITGSFKPFCISGTPNSQAIKMIVSNVNTATEWTAYPSSKVMHILNGNYDSNDEGYIVNTFVITLTTQTYLYLWGYVKYTGTTVAWAYDFAELRATRIA